MTTQAEKRRLERAQIDFKTPVARALPDPPWDMTLDQTGGAARVNDMARYHVPAGLVSGASIVHKFGYNGAVSTTYEPICIGGDYQTPQVSGATALRIKAGGDANDTAAGSGARAVTLEGIDQTGALAVETIATAGASASSPTTTTFLRLFRAYVSGSGTYATSAAGSHAAAITIEIASGGTDWAQLAVSASFPFAQTQIASYTVPLGKTAYILSFVANVDSTKAADVTLFQRRDILQTAAPYSAMRVVLQYTAVLDMVSDRPNIPIGPFPALTDIGFMARVASTTGAISATFEILLIDD